MVSMIMVTSTNLETWPLSSFRFAEWLSEERRTRVADATAAATESAQTPAQVDPSPESAPAPVAESAASETAAPIMVTAPVIIEETVIVTQPPGADQDGTSAEETEVANTASKEEEIGEDATATTATTTVTIIKEEIILKEEVQKAYVNFPYVPRAKYVKDTTYDVEPVDPSPYVPAYSHAPFDYRSGYTANPAYDESSSDSGYNTTWSSYTSLYSSPAPYGSAYNTTTGNHSGSSTYVPPPPPFEGARLTPSFQQRAVDVVEPSYSADSSYRRPRYKGDLLVRFFVIYMEGVPI
jgi:hypothetical protein